MLKILCPTDFSDHSKKAIDFTFSIAKSLNAEIHLINTFKEQRTGSSFKSIGPYIKENALKDLGRIKNEYTKNYTFENEVHLVCVEGYAADTINSYANSYKMDLLIMGTQGNNSIANRVFGSVTSKIVKHSKIPVLAVPAKTLNTFSRGNFLFPIDNKAIYSNQAFDIINTLCEKLDKKVDILHFNRSNEDSNYPFDPYINEYFGTHIDQVVIKESNNSVNSLNKYIDNHPTELLIMLRREHTLIEKTFFLSHTDQEVYKTNVPLLIIPDK